MSFGNLTLYLLVIAAIVYMWYLIIVAAIAAGTVWTIVGLWLIIQLIGVYLRAKYSDNIPIS